MKRRYKNRYTTTRRKRRVDDGLLIPILKLALCVVLALALIGAIVYFLLPWVLSQFDVEFYPPFVPVPTPEPTPEPTPTPNPLSLIDMDEFSHEVVIPQSEYRWFTDPYVYDGKLLLSAGQSVQGSIRMDALFMYDPATRASEELPISLANAYFTYPVFNDKYICYLDAAQDGGGEIMVYDRETSAAPSSIKTVYAGYPKLFLSGDYLAWTERTGSNMDKLFVCDLRTLESATLHMFESSYYGMSFPYLYGDRVLWAEEDTDIATTDTITSVIYYRDISTGDGGTLKVGTYVHDPQYNGQYYAWMDANHGVTTTLYVMEGGGGEPEPIATGVVEFGMGDDFVAYCVEEAMYVYVFSNAQTYRITGELQLAQFMGVSGNCVMWMDVTSREKDILKLADLGILTDDPTVRVEGD